MKSSFTVPALPSVTEASQTEIVGGGSSSVIVPTPWASATVAATGFVRSTVYVSLISSMVSPRTETVICFDVCPGAKLTVPLPAA